MSALKVASVAFRGFEIISAAIVAGITGFFIRQVHQAGGSAEILPRGIYTEVIAGLSLLFAIIFCVPKASFMGWPIDLFLSMAWFAAFGVMVNALNSSCLGYVSWSQLEIFRGDFCAQQKANVAFMFISAVFWLFSMIVGLVWLSDPERKAAKANHTKETPETSQV